MESGAHSKPLFTHDLIAKPVPTFADYAVMPRVKSIDGLRGIAALEVAWFHIYTQNGGNLAIGAMPKAFNVVSVWGRFGVQLFFVISGFVVAYTLFSDRSINSARSVTLYFIRRSVRLDPAYWVALACYAIGIPFLFQFVVIDVFPERRGDIPEIVQNVFYFLPVHREFYMPVAWTLVIEVEFYLLFAFVICIANLVERSGYNRLLFFHFAMVLLALVNALKLTKVLPLGPWILDHFHTFMGGIYASLSIMGIPSAGLMFVLSLL